MLALDMREREVRLTDEELEQLAEWLGRAEEQTKASKKGEGIGPNSGSGTTAERWKEFSRGLSAKRATPGNGFRPSPRTPAAGCEETCGVFPTGGLARGARA